LVFGEVSRNNVIPREANPDKGKLRAAISIEGD